MILKNATVITNLNTYKNYDVMFKNDTITHIGKNLEGDEIFDATNLYVCPGLIDIHTHGGGGGDYMDATNDSYDKALNFQSKNGITSVLTSSVTASIDKIERLINKTREYMQIKNPVTRVLGAHLEGPYISFKNKGAQHEKYLKIPSKDSYDFIIRNKDVVKNVTLSTELDGALDMVKALKENSITVSCGHDDGRYDTINPCIDAGITNLTHWYCAMSSASMKDGVRSVGMVETGLIDERLTLELIADNHHIIPDLVKLAYKNKGVRGICLVSDALRAGGMPKDGTLYKLGCIDDDDAQRFKVDDGVAKMEDGTHYAGSIQPVSQMIKNLVNDCGIPFEESIFMATYTPAKIIGMENIIGSIEVGKKADFCIMNKNLNVVATITNGRFVYKK